jgi:hypothetical protein
MPARILKHYDVMSYALKDSSDIYTISHPGLPERLDLWEEVTMPGRFFATDSLSLLGGFTLVEIYDPEYWMETKQLYGCYMGNEVR